mgnify:CR=1 FL=1
MNLDSRMTAEMIADVMRAKEGGHNNDMRMADFLHNFVNLKYSTTTLQMEFSYNLVDGIDRFKVNTKYHKEQRNQKSQTIPEYSSYRHVPGCPLSEHVRDSSQARVGLSVQTPELPLDGSREAKLQARLKAGLAV